MTDHHRDFSFSISSIDPTDISSKNPDFESSLDSYSNLFNKDQHHFTTSSEVSFVNLDDEQLNENPLTAVDHNRTFTKEITKTIFNIFTGKPISPNPWRKLCTKYIQHQIETDVIPIQVFSPDSPSNQDQTVTSQSRRNMINNLRATDSNDDDDQASEQFLQEDRIPMVIKHQRNTPIKRRTKKRNSLKDFSDNSSTSSDENIKELPSNTYPKIKRIIDNDPSWHRLADVYTSEESDERNNSFSSNTSLSIRYRSENFTFDESTSSSTKTPFDFLESLSEHVTIEDKHPDAKIYFIQFGFRLKEKRQELADKLLSLFNQDVFSSQLSNKISVTWSGRLTVTAGYCTTRRNIRTAVITLSHKICDSPERCRDTLLHEMCHAAVTLIDGVMEHGHGPLWTKWTRLAAQCYPSLPSVSVKHTYDVVYKFIYRCFQCHHEVYRHSKSLNLEVDVCDHCVGKFELIINDNNANDVRQTPQKQINKYNLYVKENFQTMKQANPHLTTPQLMKQLSTEYKKSNQQQPMIDLPDLNQLKI